MLLLRAPPAPVLDSLFHAISVCHGYGLPLMYIEYITAHIHPLLVRASG